MTLKAGDEFPAVANVKGKISGDKTVVIVSIPGAFTPTCTASHIPPFDEKFETLTSKGVDAVIVLSANDPFVRSTDPTYRLWQVNGVTDESFIFATDPPAEFSKSVGLSLDFPPAFGFVPRDTLLLCQRVW
ncbi:Redoxin-domain-containing protein [Lipomyces doorenjongii]